MFDLASSIFSASAVGAHRIDRGVRRATGTSSRASFPLLSVKAPFPASHGHVHSETSPVDDWMGGMESDGE